MNNSNNIYEESQIETPDFKMETQDQQSQEHTSDNLSQTQKIYQTSATQNEHSQQAETLEAQMMELNEHISAFLESRPNRQICRPNCKKRPRIT